MHISKKRYTFAFEFRDKAWKIDIIYSLIKFFIMKQFDEIFNYLTGNQFFTDEELILLCCINGHNVDTLNSAIYARYGFRNIEGLLDDLS